MGAFKKQIQRAPYKERSQPASRKKFGLLEKHKDYSLRAKDNNAKNAALAKLREKAANRNEDEFYFGMLTRRGPGSAATNSLLRGKRWDGTADAVGQGKRLDIDTVRLLKTQDMGYVRTMRNVAAREVERLSQEVLSREAMLSMGSGSRGSGSRGGGGGGSDDDEDEFSDSDDGPDAAEVVPKKPRKILFVDDEDGRDKRAMELAEREEGYHAEDGKGDEGTGSGQTNAELKQARLERTRRRLATAEEKLRVLATAEEEMEQQRARMAKTQTTGVVTKKTGKRIRVQVRKR